MQTGLLLTSVVLVCYFDGRYRRIPNQITFSLLLLGMVINVWQRGLLGLGGSLLGTFVGLAVLIIPYCGGGIGAGDVKFSAAIGSLMGPGFAFAAFLYGAILGGVWACAVLLKRRNLLQSLTAIERRFWFQDQGYWPHHSTVLTLVGSGGFLMELLLVWELQLLWFSAIRFKGEC